MIKRIAILCLLPCALLASAQQPSASSTNQDPNIDNHSATDAQVITGDDAPSYRFVGEPTIINADTPTAKTIVTIRRIYQCRDGELYVFADEENKHKFTECSIIREQETTTVVEPEVSVEPLLLDACSGVLRYQGNTYVFAEDQPCPIPQDIWHSLTPLEAQPSYYLDKNAK